MNKVIFSEISLAIEIFTIIGIDFFQLKFLRPLGLLSLAMVSLSIVVLFFDNFSAENPQSEYQLNFFEKIFWALGILFLLFEFMSHSAGFLRMFNSIVSFFAQAIYFVFGLFLLLTILLFFGDKNSETKPSSRGNHSEKFNSSDYSDCDNPTKYKNYDISDSAVDSDLQARTDKESDYSENQMGTFDFVEDDGGDGE